MMSHAVRCAMVFSCHRTVFGVRSDISAGEIARLALHYNMSDTETEDCGFDSVSDKWWSMPGVPEVVSSWQWSDQEERDPFDPDLYWFCNDSKEVSTHARSGCDKVPCWYASAAGVQGFIATQLSDAVRQAQGPVADIGSGTGWVLKAFRDLTEQQVWGVDGEEAAILISQSVLGESVKLVHGFFPSAVAGQHFSVLNIGFAVRGLTINDVYENPSLPASITDVLARRATVLMPVCLHTPAPDDFRCECKFVKFIVEESQVTASVVGPLMHFIVAQV
eukprot:TRINITY_DN11981_c0_g1_i2.p1 TRINITY_DN11981_c0_g1~~TRINITY_DN11981_c0_g1_i2.p1  ORF type:complete len:277 (+),score=33.14 TRINITY_DN11981_c0_g1_i2:73-903(+)